MTGIATSSYCSTMRRIERSAERPKTEEEVANAKLAAAEQDPFAMELAFRLSIADVSQCLGVSFHNCYKMYSRESNDVGWPWIFLVTICLEDKTFGKDRPRSILNHPILAKAPALRQITQSRKDQEIVEVAKRFQAAYTTLQGFDGRKPRSTGIQSFDRHLGLIAEPEDLWIVLGGLHRLVMDTPH